MKRSAFFKAQKSQTVPVRSVSQKTERSITALLEHAFDEMLGLLKSREYSCNLINQEQLEEREMSAIMFTVSSSDFKLVALLHFPQKSQLPDHAYAYLPVEQQDAEQVFKDYVSELGNNLCGVICRVLGAASFSTGMSTPAILHNANSTVHMRKVGADFEKHIAAYVHEQVLFGASMYLFFNQGVRLDLDIPIPSKAAASENLGELEFF